MDSEKPRSPLTSTGVIVLITILVVAGVGAYFFYQDNTVKCIYVPGRVVYLRIYSDHTDQGLSGIAVNGQLTAMCPVAFSGSGPHFPQSSVIGSWDFATNTTGYVTVPSSELAGSSMWFTATYNGISYKFAADICGNGTTIFQIGFPSGDWSESGIGNHTSIVNEGTVQNVLQGCGFEASGNATRT
jgi:hypothetical protein